MNKTTYLEFVNETIFELNSVMRVSLKEQVKDLAKSALGRSVRSKDPMFWPAGMLMLGLVEARKRLLDDDELEIIQEIDCSIEKHIRLWKEGYGGKIDYIDDALAGAALIKLYCQNERISDELKELCREAADKIYVYLIKAPREKSGAIAYNAERSGANVFADGVGQTTMFLSLYGRVFEVPEALDLAKRQLMAFRKYGCDERSGLPYHGYAILESKSSAPAVYEKGINDSKDHDMTKKSDNFVEGDGYKSIKKGLLSWGRAAGWLIMGLSEYVRSDIISSDEPGKSDDALNMWYNTLSETLLSYQRPDGGYAWQIQATEGPLDTSATGMILYGLLDNVNVQSDISDTPDVSDISNSIRTIDRSIVSGKVGSALSSCDDFGVHYQTYGHYPWGQGAVLAAVSKLGYT